MNVVIDTNVLISGIFWSGNYSSQVIEAWKNGEFKLITSKEIIDELVETALEGDADFIVTQDKHLLKLKDYQGIKVITPEEFLKTL